MAQPLSTFGTCPLVMQQAIASGMQQTQQEDLEVPGITSTQKDLGEKADWIA